MLVFIPIRFCFRDEFIDYQSKGMLQLRKSNVISEYLVIRELLWQFCGQHSSFTFTLENDSLVPRTNVTVASVRNVSDFLHHKI